MKKLVRSGVKCSKYIGSVDFDFNFIEYSFVPFQEETSETAVDSVDCIP
jgi:hypothetical protein